jgi:FkbM family methyltransferase
MSECNYLDVLELDLPPAPLILECGANDGSETLKFLRRWPDAKIFCFEPEPRAIEQWRSNVKDTRAELFEFALGKSDGSAEFYRSSGTCPFMGHEGDWNKSGSIREPLAHKEIWPWVKFDEQIEVSVRSLDSWAEEKQLGIVDFMWADVQGAEEDLIKGGMKTLSKTRYFYTEFYDIEVYRGQAGLAKILESLKGWRIIRRFPTDVLLINDNLPKFSE